MLKPGKDVIVKKLEGIFNNSFSGGNSLVKPDAKKTKKPVTTYDPSGKSHTQWVSKDFLFYFAEKYKTIFELTYNLSFASDLKVITNIEQFLKSMGWDYRFHVKEFIDWCFEKRQEIIKKNKFFTLRTCQGYLNEYLQSVLVEQSYQEAEEEYSLLPDLNELYDSQKMILGLRRYGIPIIATFLHNKKGHVISKVKKNLLEIDFSHEDLEKIIKASIIRSPYHPDMDLLDWREFFEKKTKVFHHEKWWREVDYSGSPPKTYEELVK